MGVRAPQQLCGEFRSQTKCYRELHSEGSESRECQRLIRIACVYLVMSLFPSQTLSSLYHNRRRAVYTKPRLQSCHLRRYRHARARCNETLTYMEVGICNWYGDEVVSRHVGWCAVDGLKGVACKASVAREVTTRVVVKL